MNWPISTLPSSHRESTPTVNISAIMERNAMRGINCASRVMTRRQNVLAVSVKSFSSCAVSPSILMVTPNSTETKMTCSISRFTMGAIRFSGTTFTIISSRDTLTPPPLPLMVPIWGTPPWNMNRPMVILRIVAMTVVHM